MSTMSEELTTQNLICTLYSLASALSETCTSINSALGSKFSTTSLTCLSKTLATTGDTGSNKIERTLEPISG